MTTTLKGTTGTGTVHRAFNLKGVGLSPLCGSGAASLRPRALRPVSADTPTTCKRCLRMEEQEGQENTEEQRRTLAIDARLERDSAAAGENWQVVAESTVTETFTVWAANADEAARLVAENRAGDPDTVTEPAVRAVLTVRPAEAFVPDCPVCRDSGVIVERYNAGDGSTTNVDPCGECPAGERIARERLELRAAAERGSR